MPEVAGQPGHTVKSLLPGEPAQILFVDFLGHRVKTYTQSITIRYAYVNNYFILFAYFFVRPENEEFAVLFELSGWNQTQAAKRFHCSQAVISRWLNDIDPADKKAVELFKFILAREKPEVLRADALARSEAPEWERKILNDLRPLRLDDRERVLKMIRLMIEGLPVPARRGRPAPANRLSSTTAADNADTEPPALKELNRLAQKAHHPSAK